jgi:hypothetical protein
LCDRAMRGKKENEPRKRSDKVEEFFVNDER